MSSKSLYNANVVLIEDKASGTQLIQELIAEGCHARHPLPAGMRQDHADACPDRDDRERLCPSPRDGALARRIPPRDDRLPKGKHDDQVDSTAQFLDWFKMPFPGQNIFELYRRQAEQLQRLDTRYVRLKAPSGVGSVQTLSGRRITIGQDGIVEMSAEDACCLIAYGWTKLGEGKLQVP